MAGGVVGFVPSNHGLWNIYPTPGVTAISRLVDTAGTRRWLEGLDILSKLGTTVKPGWTEPNPCIPAVVYIRGFVPFVHYPRTHGHCSCYLNYPHED